MDSNCEDFVSTTTPGLSISQQILESNLESWLTSSSLLLNKTDVKVEPVDDLPKQKSAAKVSSVESDTVNENWLNWNFDKVIANVSTNSYSNVPLKSTDEPCVVCGDRSSGWI